MSTGADALPQPHMAVGNLRTPVPKIAAKREYPPGLPGASSSGASTPIVIRLALFPIVAILDLRIREDHPRNLATMASG